MRIAALFLIIVLPLLLPAQDSTINFEKKIVTLKEVVIRNKLNVPEFIKRVQEDTTFYKAFLNLKILGYTSINDIRMQGKKDRIVASLNSKTRQRVRKGCRWTEDIKSEHTGDFFDKNGAYNYYTAQLYAGVFFAPDTICGEDNIAAGTSFSTSGRSGLSKHKQQLKMLLFNPGKRIPGLPFIGNKVAIFDEDIAENYDFVIDMNQYRGEMCYEFRMVPLDGKEGKVVINEMTTWFNAETWEIAGRNYDLSYRAGVYDFDVHIEVEMTHFENYLVPKVMRYNGNWNVMFRKRERGIFTAILTDFRK